MLSCSRSVPTQSPLSCADSKSGTHRHPQEANTSLTIPWLTRQLHEDLALLSSHVISEVIDISPGNPDSSFCFLQPSICHQVLCISTVSSVAQSCPILCNPMNHSTPGLPVHPQLPEFTQTHVHRVSDAIQPCHPLSSPSPSAPNPSQHQSLFQ